MTRRLLVTYLAFALLILVALEVPLAYAHQRNDEQVTFERLEHDADILAAFVDTALAAGDRADVDVLAHETAQRLAGSVDVLDATGKPLSGSRTASAAVGPDIRAVLAGRGRVTTRKARLNGVSMMSVTVPVGPGVVPQGAIRVSVPRAALQTRAESFGLLLGGVGLAVLGVAALIAFALARWISRPVRALELATRRLADGEAPTPLPISTGPSELRRLAVTFTATADRLRALIDSQRSFIGHASHQLKTPLSALRLRLENLEPDITGAGVKNLRAALAETDRLAQMVETLLAMARHEQSTLPPVGVPIGEAVAQRVFQWAPLAAVRDVRLDAAPPDGVVVLAVPGAIEQILDNLLSNALRAAPPGSTIAVSWAARGASTEVHVVDEGAGLTAEQRVRALEPFWRAPGAGRDGTGLGLSLVCRLAEASGGSAELHAAAGTGIDAVVTLPTWVPTASMPAPAEALQPASLGGGRGGTPLG